MNVHINVSRSERNAAQTSYLHHSGQVRRAPAMQWGEAPVAPRAPKNRSLQSPLFDPAQAPAGARLVRFSDLADGQCQWGFDVDGGNLFCGLPVDPAAKGTKLFGRYCPCHVKAATGRTVVR